MHFFTSDTHLAHTKILGYDERPYDSIDAHDQDILDRHNSVVRKDDHVWHLGDASFSAEKLFWYLEKANGYIHLIRGNHDDNIAWKHRDRFASSHEAFYLHRSENQSSLSIYLSHYAMLRWRNSNHGSLHLFGHSHGKLKSPMSRSMDIGVTCNNYTPVSISQVIEKLGNQPIPSYD
jgi:calcineurin-like phosphoesterase family protein